jgi:hypothetical protein
MRKPQQLRGSTATAGRSRRAERAGDNTTPATAAVRCAVRQTARVCIARGRKGCLAAETHCMGAPVRLSRSRLGACDRASCASEPLLRASGAEGKSGQGGQQRAEPPQKPDTHAIIAGAGLCAMHPTRKPAQNAVRVKSCSDAACLRVVPARSHAVSCTKVSSRPAQGAAADGGGGSWVRLEQYPAASVASVQQAGHRDKRNPSGVGASNPPRRRGPRQVKEAVEGARAEGRGGTPAAAQAAPGQAQGGRTERPSTAAGARGEVQLVAY